MRKIFTGIAALAATLALTAPAQAAEPTLNVYAYAYGQVYATATATCPDGYHVTGGGFDKYPQEANLTASSPSWDGRGWVVSAENQSGGGVSVSATAICQMTT